MLTAANGNFANAVSVTPRPAGTATCISVVGKTANGNWQSGDPSNSVVDLNIGAGNSVTGAAADVTVTSFSPSWLSESSVTFSSTTTADPNAISLTPGVGMDNSGTIEYTTSGVIDFTDNGLPDIPVNADGIIRLEWSESFDDTSIDPDSEWSESTAPVTCQGIYLTCTDQAACDAAAGGGAGGPPLEEARELPTLSQWAMGLLALGLGMLAFRSRKRLFPMS